jgi:dihydroflavonol-4-reductase
MGASVLVIGGTGLLGYHTVKELVSRGYTVTSLALPPIPAENLFPAGVTSILDDVDTMSDEQLSALMEGVHAVLYAIGADERVTPPAPAARFFYEANAVPTQRVARLARKAGVAKFVVYGSYTAEFGEKWPELGYRERNGYPRVRLLQEELAYMEGDGAMDVMSLRLPYIFGSMPGRVPLWSMFVDIVRSQPEMVAVAAGATGSVTVGQVARAAVGAIVHGEHGGRYPIDAYRLSYEEFHKIICEELGRDPQQVVVVPKEAMIPAMTAADQAAADAGLEHGVHILDSLEFNYREAYTDPAVTAVLDYDGGDDVAAEVRETIRVCLALEADEA